MTSHWNQIRTITGRELMAYFHSPVAYVFIVIFLLLSGFFTFMIGGFFERGEASLTFPFFMWHPWLYLFLVPAMGMRLWSEEQRTGTLELLLTYPISPWQAIVGKFLAAWSVIILALLLTFPVVLTVCYLGDPDTGIILSGYLGSILLSGTYLAVTCITSACTRNQVIAFILSVTVCMLLLLAGYPPVINPIIQFAPNARWLVDFIASLSVMTHYEDFQRGVLDVGSLVYFLSTITFCLFLTAQIIHNQRK